MTQKTRERQKQAQAWNSIKGTMRLWATKRERKSKSWMTFSTSIGKKDDAGDYDNVYFDVLFKKDEAPNVNEGPCGINIRKGFLTLSVYSDGSIHPAVMVLEYVLLDEEKAGLKDKREYKEIGEDEIPF